MASWMVHLRVAQAVATQFPSLFTREFIVGNIAPDSGVPNKDWSAFEPSTDISHFKSKNAQGERVVEPQHFVDKYLTPVQSAAYTPTQRAFYLGYWCHLLTDVLWVRDIVAASITADADTYHRDPSAAIWKWKKDWYDLDFLYLRDHPDFEAFAVYAQAADIENIWMEEFSRDAFALRCVYITAFYRSEEKHGVLDRDYPYLTKARMDAFVRDAAEQICRRMTTFLPEVHKDFAPNTPKD